MSRNLLGHRTRHLFIRQQTAVINTIRAHLAEHIRLAQLFASWVDENPDFERLAPVPLSVVCFRWNPMGGERLSETELDAANLRLAVTGTPSVNCPHCQTLVRFRLDQIERRQVTLTQ